MRFFTNVMHDPEVNPTEIRTIFESYKAHLEAIRDRLPIQVYEFASAPWHYDGGEQGLHDSWVESLLIEELSSGSRHQKRSLQIRVKLLGAYHDRYIELTYKKVRKYKLKAIKDKDVPMSNIGHGDWLYDEFDVSRKGLVIHKVRFRSGSTWQINCRDLEVNFIPITK
jgi:hypothetical protein